MDERPIRPTASNQMYAEAMETDESTAFPSSSNPTSGTGGDSDDRPAFASRTGGFANLGNDMGAPGAEPSGGGDVDMMAADGMEETFEGPLLSRLTHKNWKARKQAYEELAKIYTSELPDNENATSSSFTDLFPKFLGESNAPTLESGIACLIAFFDKAPLNVSQPLVTSSSPILAPLVDKCLCQATKPAIPKKAIELAQLMMEVGTPTEVVPQIMERGFKHKTPKARLACVQCVNQAVKNFGDRVPFGEILQKNSPLIPLISDQNGDVRKEAQGLLAEVYGFGMKEIRATQLFSKLQDAQKAQLEKLFTDADAAPAPVPARKLRAELVPGRATTERDDTPPVRALATMGIFEVSPVLSKLPKNFFDKVVGTDKWSERKETLEILENLVSKPRLEQADYHECVRVLKKLLNDTNIPLVSLSVKIIGKLAQGLGSQGFAPYSAIVFAVLLEKFKEKNKTVSKPLTDTMDILYSTQSVTLWDYLEPITTAFNHKIPEVRQATIDWVRRCFLLDVQNSNVSNVSRAWKALAPAVTKMSGDGVQNIRDASLGVMGIAQAVLGEAATKAHVVGMDKKQLDKLQKAVESVAKPVLKDESMEDATAHMVGSNTSSDSAGSSESQRKRAIESPRSDQQPPSTKRFKSPTASASTTGLLTSSGSSSSLGSLSASLSARGPPSSTSNVGAASGASTARGPPKAGQMPPRQGRPGGAACPTGGKSAEKESGGNALPLTIDDAENRIAALGIPAQELLAQLGNKQFGERLAAIEGIETAVKSLKEEELSANAEALLMVIKQRLTFKDANFQVQLKCFQLIADVITRCRPFPRSIVSLVLDSILDRLSDGKQRAICGDCLQVLADAASAKFLFGQITRLVAESKSPKTDADALEWMASYLERCGANSPVEYKPLTKFIKAEFEKNHPLIKTNGTKVLVALRSIYGPAVREMLEDVKPSLLSTIDGEFAKIPADAMRAPPPVAMDDDDSAPALTSSRSRAVVRSGSAKPRNRSNSRPTQPGAAGTRTNSQPAPLSARSRTPELSSSARNKTPEMTLSSSNSSNALSARAADITAQITPVLLDKLADANWKTRQETLTQLENLFSSAQNRKIGSNVNQLPTALKARLADSNKNLVIQTMSVISLMAQAMGPTFRVHVQLLVPAVLHCLTDNKNNVRDATTRTLTTIISVCGFEILISFLPKIFSLDSPSAKQDLSLWLANTLEQNDFISSLPAGALQPLIPSNLALLSDRGTETRRNAELLLSQVIKNVGFDTVEKHARDLKPAVLKALQPVLDRHRFGQNITNEQQSQNLPVGFSTSAQLRIDTEDELDKENSAALASSTARGQRAPATRAVPMETDLNSSMPVPPQRSVTPALPPGYASLITPMTSQTSATVNEHAQAYRMAFLKPEGVKSEAIKSEPTDMEVDGPPRANTTTNPFLPSEFAVPAPLPPMQNRPMLSIPAQPVQAESAPLSQRLNLRLDDSLAPAASDNLSAPKEPIPNPIAVLPPQTTKPIISALSRTERWANAANQSAMPFSELVGCLERYPASGESAAMYWTALKSLLDVHIPDFGESTALVDLGRIVMVLSVHMRRVVIQNPEIDVAEIKLLLQCLQAVFGRRLIASRLQLEHLDTILGTVVECLKEERIKRVLPAIDSEPILKAINALVLKILENSDRTMTFRALVAVLTKQWKMFMDAPTNSGNRRGIELASKCLLKITQFVGQTIDSIDLRLILWDVHRFFTDHPPSQLRDHNDETLMRTLKSVLNELVKAKGPSIKDFIDVTPKAMIIYYLDSFLAKNGMLNQTARPTPTPAVPPAQNQQVSQAIPAVVQSVPTASNSQASLARRGSADAPTPTSASIIAFAVNHPSSTAAGPAPATSLIGSAPPGSALAAFRQSLAGGSLVNAISASSNLGTRGPSMSALLGSSNNGTQATTPTSATTSSSSSELNPLAAKMDTILSRIRTKETTMQGIEELFVLLNEHATLDVEPWLVRCTPPFQSYLKRQLVKMADLHRDMGKATGNHPLLRSSVSPSPTNAPIPSPAAPTTTTNTHQPMPSSSSSTQSSVFQAPAPLVASAAPSVSSSSTSSAYGSSRSPKRGTAPPPPTQLPTSTVLPHTSANPYPASHQPQLFAPPATVTSTSISRMASPSPFLGSSDLRPASSLGQPMVLAMPNPVAVPATTSTDSMTLDAIRARVAALSARSQTPFSMPQQGTTPSFSASAMTTMSGMGTATTQFSYRPPF